MHHEQEHHGWDINLVDHPPRADSNAYARSRARLKRLTAEAPPPLFGPGPWDDHHGGGLWVKDAEGWFMVRNVAGIEWSAQFAAAPDRVDELRKVARRLYAGFPGSAEALGIRDLLDTPITDAEGVSAWVDSICNASVPLNAADHTGVLPNGAGEHHYPKPITDIEKIKRDDFQLWTTDAQGQPVAVVPVAPVESGDRRVMVVWSTPGTALAAEHNLAQRQGKALILPAGHPIARMAFLPPKP